MSPETIRILQGAWFVGGIVFVGGALYCARLWRQWRHDDPLNASSMAGNALLAVVNATACFFNATRP
jgi:hypothetical protein